MYMYTHELVYDFLLEQLLEERCESERIFNEARQESDLFYGSMDAVAFFNVREIHVLQCEKFRNGVKIIQLFADELDAVAVGLFNVESLWKKFSEIFIPMFSHKKGVYGQTLVELYIQVG
jgi:hypothetical protein